MENHGNLQQQDIFLLGILTSSKNGYMKCFKTYRNREIYHSNINFLFFSDFALHFGSFICFRLFNGLTFWIVFWVKLQHIPSIQKTINCKLLHSSVFCRDHVWAILQQFEIKVFKILTGICVSETEQVLKVTYFLHD